MIEEGDGKTPAQVIAARVARLFLRFPSSRLTDATAEATIAAYALDLEPFPLWAIDQAMLEAIQKGGSFAPSSPDLRKAAERAMVPLRTEAADLRAVLGAEVYHEPTPDEQARGRAMFEGLIAELKLREPFLVERPRVPADMTRQEAEAALERLQANPQPLPKLSEEALTKFGLPPSKPEAAA